MLLIINTAAVHAYFDTKLVKINLAFEPVQRLK